jgi:hypothetical protein
MRRDINLALKLGLDAALLHHLGLSVSHGIEIWPQHLLDLPGLSELHFQVT